MASSGFNPFPGGWWDPLNWGSNLAQTLIGSTQDAMKSFFSGFGGWIASGIETGVVALAKDFWHVIEPAAEIIMGVIIIVLTLMVGLGGSLPRIPLIPGSAS